MKRTCYTTEEIYAIIDKKIEETREQLAKSIERKERCLAEKNEFAFNLHKIAQECRECEIIELEDLKKEF